MSLLDTPRPPEGVDDSFQRMGRHDARVAGDVIWLRSVRALELDDLVQIFELGYGVGERYGYILFWGDARLASPLTAEARRYQLEQNKRRNFPSHTAIYGASLVVRTMVALTQRAM